MRFCYKETGGAVVKHREIISWALYDFANTIFSTTIVVISSLTIFFGAGLLILRKIPQH